MDKAEVPLNNKFMNSRSITGTRSFHHFIPQSSSVIEAYLLSGGNTSKQFTLANDKEKNSP